MRAFDSLSDDIFANNDFIDEIIVFNESLPCVVCQKQSKETFMNTFGQEDEQVLSFLVQGNVEFSITIGSSVYYRGNEFILKRVEVDSVNQTSQLICAKPGVM